MRLMTFAICLIGLLAGSCDEYAQAGGRGAGLGLFRGRRQAQVQNNIVLGAAPVATVGASYGYQQQVVQQAAFVPVQRQIVRQRVLAAPVMSYGYAQQVQLAPQKVYVQQQAVPVQRQIIYQQAAPVLQAPVYQEAGCVAPGAALQFSQGY